MEQSVNVDSGAETNCQNYFTTPYRIPKRLFVPLSNSSKRSLFREENEIKQDFENASDAESDIGHMSPLALTDQSSCDNSPERQFISPLTTPKKSPIIPLSSWDCLIPICKKNNSIELTSSFNSIKRITKSKILSPKQIFIPSFKSKSKQLSKNTQADCTLTNQNLVAENIMPDEIVPETPAMEYEFNDQQSYVAETPQKEEYCEDRLITPLGSVYKNIPIPRLHRRKSLGILEFNEYTSPEIKKYTLKRHLDDSLMYSNLKYQKIDEFSVVPKARAALFQEINKHINNKDHCFTLNPKCFYGTEIKSNNFGSVQRKQLKTNIKKKRSLPTHNSICKRSMKRNKKGEINCGVGHGIKKPKIKRQISQNNVKVDILNHNVTKINESKENVNPKKKISNEKGTNLIDINASKKFLKFKPKVNAVVTMLDKIKLKVYNNQRNVDHINKKSKLDENLFDTADLSVDEPAVESSIEQNKVDNILRILEDDWKDDEIDVMETIQTVCSKIKSSPKKSSMLKDLTMSPASELSNMASTMNIKDVSTTETLDNVKVAEPVSQKYYPLFSKRDVTTIHNDTNFSKKHRNTSWQLSSKYGNTENQYQIDAGQKMFGARQCNECEIIYYTGDPDDENAHLNYHNSFKNLKFQGWKNERVIYRDSYTSSRIILIEPKDSNLYWKKVTEVLEIVDRDLGLSDMKLPFYRDKRVLMYVRDKTIISVLVAEYVKSAFQMIPEFLELNCCTSESVPVKCGINVVWTAMSHRRQGIATKLVDTLRANYYYGYIMSIDDIAFSTPTPSGKQFAEKYTKTRNFKVY